ncbi:MAG: hypothetical protein LBL49_09170 [Clostridiales Family XIII bacterium]|nr:hypothetical protein [Clostridiales Family XIII bacterium]
MIYRQIVSADALSTVIPIPQIFRNKRVEVIIREAPVAVYMSKIDMENIGHMMDGSITQSLIGIVPNSGKTLDDYRAERLSEYERID